MKIKSDIKSVKQAVSHKLTQKIQRISAFEAGFKLSLCLSYLEVGSELLIVDRSDRGDPSRRKRELSFPNQFRVWLIDCLLDRRRGQEIESHGSCLLLLLPGLQTIRILLPRCCRRSIFAWLNT